MNDPKVIETEIPVRIESSLNLRENWRTRARRNSSHRSAAWFAMKAAAKFTPDILPCVVTLTRVAPRPLDLDNNIGGCKSVVDGIADWLGIDDRDPRVQWRYAQAKSDKPKHYTVRVRVEAA